MTEHTRFGHACGAAGEYEAAALAWLLLTNSLFNGFFTYILGQGKEFVPLHIPLGFVFEQAVVFANVVDHHCFHLGELIYYRIVFLQLGNAVHYYDLGIRRLSLIKTRLSIISGIYATGNAISLYRPHESNDPLRRIMSHDVDTCPFLHSHRMHGFRKHIRFMSVFSPCPFLYPAFSLHKQSMSFGLSTYSLLELLTQC